MAATRARFSRWFDFPRVDPACAAGLMALVVAWVVITAFAEPYVASSLGSAHDAHDYWTALRASDPYAAAPNWGRPGAYVYSPAFLQVTTPLLALPWTLFVGVWTAIAMVAVLLLTPARALVLIVPLVLVELWGGNIHLLLAAAIVVGFRWPHAWAFVVLTKVTPGIGLLWFVMRREWRSLAVALSACAAIASVSFVIAPELWREWIGVLIGRAGVNPTTSGVIPVPLVVRLPVACALIVWGAPRDKRWVLPVACMLALPAWWIGGFAMLLAIPALERRRLSAAAGERLRSLPHTLGNEPGQPRGATLWRWPITPQ